MPEEQSRLADRIAELELSKRRLAQVISELAHEGRRVSDALERVGGADRDLQKKLRGLRRNIELNETEIGKLDDLLIPLRRRLLELGEP